MPAGVFSEVTPEMGNRVLFNAPPSPPRIVSAANSPPSHQIPIPSPERRHRRTFEILEDDLKTKLSFPSFRTAKQCGATHSLGRRTCANCGIVYGSFGGFVVEDDFCSADCRTNFHLQAPPPATSTILSDKDMSEAVADASKVACALVAQQPDASNNGHNGNANNYKRIMPVTVSRDNMFEGNRKSGIALNEM
mmetsp:Transcript_9023/g.18232  ORF Transcript_9023/g.18232 Transcript_9023/m.18232 type:complete len:193 (+) Transcript_9023:131-709(+)|eukprot:CAMPEP_0118654550 /NCGR_PEP_ID=MMETSP0785-20121206/12454_1 /TAXON_ID=91992 /ORGANISM="Bolidomonas pacifica, Strain CCMP 1866" /LENGTH=192 /DNA_ID=CAMNT_0006547227 /DNA_START=218 /DNA_END=796 /DNA_ORIENTATION=-